MANTNPEPVEVFTSTETTGDIAQSVLTGQTTALIKRNDANGKIKLIVGNHYLHGR